MLFSDLIANAIMKWTPDGSVSVYRKGIFAGPFPDGVQIGSNGLTLDREGRVVAAEHGNRRVSRFERDGSVTVLADHYQGKRLNSPNDVVAKRNGDIYFTDPTALYRSFPEGPSKPKQELDFNGVYRVTAAGKLDLLTKDVQYADRRGPGDTMESSMADARDNLVLKKRTLENDMRDLVTKFENETGLSITKIRLVRDEVTGNAKPVLQRTEATVELISG